MLKRDQCVLAVATIAVCVVLMVIGWTKIAMGQGRSVALPEEQRTEEAVRWLAVAFIAEAGWADPAHAKAEADHRAIYHVLRRRWLGGRKRFPKLTFVRMVQHYVAAFDPRTAKGGRVRWLLSLRHGAGEIPAGWPSSASWDRHRPWWAAAQARASRCLWGVQCRDPYPTAKHWGGDMDRPARCMVELDNAGTFNTFFAVDRECVRHRKRRARK